MTGPIFDTHAHYSARAFDADRYPLLDSLPGKGVVLKAVLRVCQARMYPVHLVQLPKSAFAVLLPFMVAPNHYGWWMELLWKMLLMWDLMIYLQVMLKL